MTGRGWLVIYGILLLTVLYLFISVAGLKGDVSDLRADVAKLADESASVTPPSEAPVATPAPSSAPGGDLSSASGRDARRKEDLGKIADALSVYQQSKGSYPAGLNELTPDYLGTLPADPLSPRYNYRYHRTSSGFVLTSVLEERGGPDDARGDGKADGIFTVTENARNR